MDRSLVMTHDEYETETIKRALEGDHEAGREALRLCWTGLIRVNISRPLAEYLAERLRRIDQALDEANELRKVKQSSGSIRSSRDAAIAEALCINKATGRPRDPWPAWQLPYAAFGALLLNAGFNPEKVKGAMDEARQRVEGKEASLHRREAEKILKGHSGLRSFDTDDLLSLAGPLREILPTYLPQERQR